MYYDYDEHQEDKIPHILNIRLKLWLCIFLNPAFMIMVRLPRLNLLSQAPFLFATPSSPPCSLLLLKTDFHVSITAPNGHERARAQNGKCGVHRQNTHETVQGQDTKDGIQSAKGKTCVH
jgi:hypothetical protein